MQFVWDGFVEALRRLLSGDAETYRITWLSLQVSGIATLISLAIGAPLGLLLALALFPGRRLAITLVNTGMGFPPVVVGTFVSLLLFRHGPLGFMHLFLTARGMIMAQTIIAMPLVCGFTLAAIGGLDSAVLLQIRALGASRLQGALLLVREARLGMLAAVMAGFGAVISEVGATIAVGGNIKDQTRTLTGAIVLENGRGEFDQAIALSIILMALIFAVNLVLTFAQQHRRG
ncbi:MAG TPA: ABC transporter permease [Dehalococcoidia bacterium]